MNLAKIENAQTFSDITRGDSAVSLKDENEAGAHALYADWDQITVMKLGHLALFTKKNE